eukprot:GHVS01069649.1.p1 GENE.GHVS01069649.1~~GHVS01069649.1.p1  ORF type:complete len:887 (+),score=109.43 GHVS01069649.1:858-3518(+)
MSKGYITTVVSLTICSTRDLHPGALLPIALPPLPNLPTAAMAPAPDSSGLGAVYSKNVLMGDDLKTEIRRMIKGSLDLASSVCCFVEPAARLHQTYFCPHRSRIDRNFDPPVSEESFLCDLCLCTFLSNASLLADIPLSPNWPCDSPVTPLVSLHKRQIVGLGCAGSRSPDQPSTSLPSDAASRMVEHTTFGCQLDRQRGMAGVQQQGQDLGNFVFEGMLSPGGRWLPPANDEHSNAMKVTEESRPSEIQKSIELDLLANEHRLVESAPSVRVPVPAQKAMDPPSESESNSVSVASRIIGAVASIKRPLSPSFIGHSNDPHGGDVFGCLSDTLQIDTMQWATMRHAAAAEPACDYTVSDMLEQFPLAGGAPADTAVAYNHSRDGSSSQVEQDRNEMAHNGQSTNRQEWPAVGATDGLARPRKRRQLLHQVPPPGGAAGVIQVGLPKTSGPATIVEDWWRNICSEFSDVTLHGVLKVRQDAPCLPAPLPLDASVSRNEAERRNKCGVTGDSEGELSSFVKSTSLMYAARWAQLVAEAQIQPEINEQMEGGLAEYLENLCKPHVDLSKGADSTERVGNRFHGGIEGGRRRTADLVHLDEVSLLVERTADWQAAKKYDRKEAAKKMKRKRAEYAATIRLQKERSDQVVECSGSHPPKNSRQAADSEPEEDKTDVVSSRTAEGYGKDQSRRGVRLFLDFAKCSVVLGGETWRQGLRRGDLWALVVQAEDWFTPAKVMLVRAIWKGAHPLKDVLEVHPICTSQQFSPPAVSRHCSTVHTMATESHIHSPALQSPDRSFAKRGRGSSMRSRGNLFGGVKLALRSALRIGNFLTEFNVMEVLSSFAKVTPSKRRDHLCWFLLIFSAGIHFISTSLHSVAVSSGQRSQLSGTWR